MASVCHQIFNSSSNLFRMTDFCEIDQLVKLFNPQRSSGDSDSDEEKNFEEKKCTSDGDSAQPRVNPYAKIVPEEKKQQQDVDDIPEETYLTSENEETLDWKQTPKWTISYRQQVTASDVFLQMGARTPGTASCEDMIVAIDLPGEHVQNIDIKVHRSELEVHSPRFSLKMPLPHPVHPQKGDAKWEAELGKLTVTLRMEREFDFVNF